MSTPMPANCPSFHDHFIRADRRLEAACRCDCRGAGIIQGLRQDQLAAAAGVGVRFLVELEHGKPTVRMGKVLAVLDALGYRLQVTPPPEPPGSGS
jgi:y4mF family transcriptional regulator